MCGTPEEIYIVFLLGESRGGVGQGFSPRAWRDWAFFGSRSALGGLGHPSWRTEMPRANFYVLGCVEATPTPKRTPTTLGEESNCTPLGIALRAMDGSGTAVVFQNTISPLQIALPYPQQRGTEVQIRRPAQEQKMAPLGLARSRKCAHIQHISEQQYSLKILLQFIEKIYNTW